MHATRNHAETTPRQYGATAFHDGIRCSPGDDGTFMDFIVRTLGFGPESRTARMTSYREWIDGWRGQANQAETRCEGL